MSYTQSLYHIIFSTKNRKPFIEEEIQEPVCAYIGGILRNQNAKLIIGKAQPDHIHLYASLHSQNSLAYILNSIKTNSTKWIHRKYSLYRAFEWQREYSAFSISKAHEKHLINYIKNQKDHHKQASFNEELINLLNEYGIKFDKRYIWR
jgi:REP element-mobilizing transposase RayT